MPIKALYTHRHICQQETWRCVCSEYRSPGRRPLTLCYCPPVVLSGVTQGEEERSKENGTMKYVNDIQNNSSSAFVF